jgi:hypothetical protein
MSTEITHNAFRVTSDPADLTMHLSLMKDGVKLGSVEIDTKEAAAIAGIILGSARDAYDRSGKPPPSSSKEEKIDLTAIHPSGYGIGPGRKPTSSMLIFHFGDTALGIELPNSGLIELGQRLMTLGAEGSAQ